MALTNSLAGRNFGMLLLGLWLILTGLLPLLNIKVSSTVTMGLAVLRIVALKILSAEVARDQQRLYRFLQEARAASSLNHPSVAHIYEIGETPGAHFIAMEYVEGEPLDKKLSGRPLAVAEILKIAIQL